MRGKLVIALVGLLCLAPRLAAAQETAGWTGSCAAGRVAAPCEWTW